MIDDKHLQSMDDDGFADEREDNGAFRLESMEQYPNASPFAIEEGSEISEESDSVKLPPATIAAIKSDLETSRRRKAKPDTLELSLDRLRKVLHSTTEEVAEFTIQNDLLSIETTGFRASDTDEEFASVERPSLTQRKTKIKAMDAPVWDDANPANTTAKSSRSSSTSGKRKRNVTPVPWIPIAAGVTGVSVIVGAYFFFAAKKANEETAAVTSVKSPDRVNTLPSPSQNRTAGSSGETSASVDGKVAQSPSAPDSVATIVSQPVAPVAPAASPVTSLADRARDVPTANSHPDDSVTVSHASPKPGTISSSKSGSSKPSSSQTSLLSSTQSKPAQAQPGHTLTVDARKRPSSAPPGNVPAPIASRAMKEPERRTPASAPQSKSESPSSWTSTPSRSESRTTKSTNSAVPAVGTSPSAASTKRITEQVLSRNDNPPSAKSSGTAISVTSKSPNSKSNTKSTTTTNTSTNTSANPSDRAASATAKPFVQSTFTAIGSISVRNATTTNPRFSIQVHSTAYKVDADRWLERLRQRRVPEGYVTEQLVRGRVVYNVRFGSFRSKADAEAAMQKASLPMASVCRVQ
ncbi:MAG: SPOR domain-containing protein [Candidatus Kapaibacterium sp.]